MYPCMKGVKTQYTALITAKDAKFSILLDDKNNCSGVHLRKSIGIAVPGSHSEQFAFRHGLTSFEIHQRSRRTSDILIIDSNLPAEPEKLQAAVKNDATIDRRQPSQDFRSSKHGRSSPVPCM